MTALNAAKSHKDEGAAGPSSIAKYGNIAMRLYNLCG